MSTLLSGAETDPACAEPADPSSLTAGKLLLVDAYSLLFRAFFSSRNLTTADGRPTGALFGFCNMLLTLLSAQKPDAVIVCWDAPEQTLRSQEFEAYKGHRPEPDPQLRAQMPEARRLVEAMGIQAAELPGYEADDLIGTAARVGLNEGFTVTILTGDSDQLQLVRPGVTVEMTLRGVTDVRIYDEAAIRERYGIAPTRIPDWKALVGDTSDNIPGVPGIGEKTATALLQKWDSLENLLNHAAEVTPPRAKAALENARPQAEISKRLATIVCDAPLTLTIRPYRPGEAEWQSVRQIFAEYEFHSLLRRIPEAEQQAPEPPRALTLLEPEVRAIESAERWAAALAEVRQAGAVSVRGDLRTDASGRQRLHGLGFAASSETAWYVALRQPEPTEDSEPTQTTPAATGSEFSVSPAEIEALITGTGVQRYGHDVKRLESALEAYGVSPTRFDFDSLIAAYLLNAGRSSYPLPELTETYLGARFETSSSFAPELSTPTEAAALSALAPVLRSALDDAGMSDILSTIEMPLIPVLTAVERAGLLVDMPYLHTLAVDLGTQSDALARDIYALAGEEFNIGSTKQLQAVLFDKLQLPTGKKTKTGFSTGADILEQLAPQYEIARKIIDYRELSKLKVTYADALVRLADPRTHRVHTSLNQTVASSGRLSSSDPNLQNIPVRSELGRRIRRAFIAPPGNVLLSCDYSQIELRILAHITGDAALTAAFRKDEDVHTATAATVFGVPLLEVTPDQRRQAKTINFAVIYGQSGFALASTLGVSASLANTWIKEYFSRLPGVERYIEETAAQAHRQRYVSTLLGRRRTIPELDSPNHAMRQYGERAAVNMPIQGTAADIMKLAMIEVHRFLKEECSGGCEMILQVHDELLFEVDENSLSALLPEIRSRMESAFALDVPLKVDARAGANWADMSSL